MDIREAKPEDFEELKEFCTRMNEVIHQRGNVGKPGIRCIRLMK